MPNSKANCLMAFIIFLQNSHRNQHVFIWHSFCSIHHIPNGVSLYIIDGREKNERQGGDAMGEIRWEKDFEKALAKAADTKKPIFHDFWFDG